MRCCNRLQRSPPAASDEHAGALQFFQETGRKKKMKIHLADRDTQYKVNADQGDIRFIFLGGRESRASAGDVTAPK
jgi:hypothetical protein